MRVLYRGRWCASREEACLDALRAGLAHRLSRDPKMIELGEAVRMEEDDGPLPISFS